MMLARERSAVASGAHRLAAEGLVPGSAGNVSARSGELVAISPAGSVLGELQAEAVAIVDRHGERLAGDLRPSSELPLHLGLYRRHEAGAIVHSHAPLATALACVLDELPVVHYGLMALGGAIRVARYATTGTEELAEATLEGLEGRSAVLMANHGTLAYGDTVAQAVERTLLLEWACGVYWRAACLGAPRMLDAEQQAEALRAAQGGTAAAAAGAGAATQAGAGH